MDTTKSTWEYWQEPDGYWIGDCSKLGQVIEAPTRDALRQKAQNAIQAIRGHLGQEGSFQIQMQRVEPKDYHLELP